MYTDKKNNSSEKWNKCSLYKLQFIPMFKSHLYLCIYFVSGHLFLQLLANGMIAATH